MSANMTVINGTWIDIDNGTDDAVSPAGIQSGYWIARVLFNGIFGTIFEIFGLIGNVVSIVVLMHYKQKASTPLLLIFLAVFDIIYLFWEMILEQLTLLSKFEIITSGYRPFITPVYVLFFPIPKIAFTGSTTMTLLITIERYIAVVYPLRAATLCSKSAARKAIGAVFVWIVLFNLPRCLAYTYHHKWNPETNTTKIKFIRTAYGEGMWYNDIYIPWVTVTLEFLLPFLTIAVLNVQLLLAVRRGTALSQNKDCKDLKRRDGRLTAMVLAVTTMFFICGILHVSALILVRGVNNYTEISDFLNNYAAVTDTLVIINSAVNFILYCFIGKKFRNIFLSMFCCRKQANYSVRLSNITKSTSLVATRDSNL